MNIEAEKLDLIQWLTQLTDENIISKIKALKGGQEDWWNMIGAEEKKEIQEGLSQANRGELISHDDVMEKYKKWL